MKYDNYNIDFYPPNWHRPHSDLEVAAVPIHGHGCCDSGEEECVCVTPEDIELWNQISALSGISGIDWDNLNTLTSLSSSANLWNDNYNIVSENSANWENKLDTSAYEEYSAFWQKASEKVSSYSANWNKAYNIIPNVEENTENIEKLSADFEKKVKIYFDTTTIDGDGTFNNPYTVNDYTTYKDVVNTMYNIWTTALYKNNTQQWLSLTAENDEDGINPYIKSLFSAVAVKDTDQDITLNKHGDLIQWIIENMGKGAGGGMLWKYTQIEPNKDNISSFVGNDTMWYYYR